MQHNAGVVLDWIERRDREAAALVRLKEALVSSGNWKPDVLFPDRFLQEETTDLSRLDEEGVEVDYSGVEWKFGSEAVDEYQALMDQISSLTKGAISGDQMRDPDEGWR